MSWFVIHAMAYVLYKRHKAEFIRAVQENTGCAVTEADIVNFKLAARAPSQLEAYRRQAFMLLNNFMEQSLAVRVAQLGSDFASTHVSKQLELVHSSINERRSWKRWLADVGANLFVNFATILVIAGLIFGYQHLDEIGRALAQLTGIVPP